MAPYWMSVPEYPGAVYASQTDTEELRVNGRAVPVMAEAQKAPGGTCRTYNGALELKRAGVTGETVWRKDAAAGGGSSSGGCGANAGAGCSVLGKGQINTGWRRTDAEAMWKCPSLPERGRR